MTDISRRDLGKALIGFSLLGLMGATAGCTTGGQTQPTPGASGTAAAKGGTFTMAVDADITLNPGKSASAGAIQMAMQAIYDTLLHFDADGTIKPGLAEKYEQSADKKTLTLTLRDGLKFSDGTALDAAAVKGSIDYMKTAGGSDASRAQPLTVTAKDAKTVVFTTEQPYALLPMFLCLSVGTIAAPAQLASPEIDTTPIGAGPYMYDKAKSTSGNTYTLVRNPNYNAPTAYPYDTVVFKIMTDVTARLSALQTGQVNAAPLNPQTAKAAEGAGLTVMRNKTNWNGIIIADRTGQKIPALGNVKVRQAMNMAFDRAAMVTASLQGEGEPSNQIFPPTSDAYRADLKDMYPYDIAKAKALMAEAGFADGFTVEIPLIEGFTTTNPIIVTQLKQLGITVTEKKVPLNQAFAQVLGGEYALVPIGLEMRNALWDVVQSVTPGAIWNVMHQTTPEVVALSEKVQVGSAAESKQAAQELGKYLIDNAWFVVFNYANSIFATDKKTTAKDTVGSGYPYFPTYAPKA